MALPRKQEPSIGEFTVVPLIDLLMTILIFALVGGTSAHDVTEFSDPTRQPTVGQGNAARAQSAVTIVIDQQGRPRIGGDVFTLAALKQQLKLIKQKNPAAAVVIDADGRTSIQSTLDVHMLCIEVIGKGPQLALRKPTTRKEGTP
jgi:biopolymer transport protein ExbD